MENAEESNDRNNLIPISSTTIHQRSFDQLNDKQTSRRSGTAFRIRLGIIKVPTCNVCCFACLLLNFNLISLSSFSWLGVFFCPMNTKNAIKCHFHREKKNRKKWEICWFGTTKNYPVCVSFHAIIWRLCQKCQIIELHFFSDQWINKDGFPLTHLLVNREVALMLSKGKSIVWRWHNEWPVNGSRDAYTSLHIFFFGSVYLYFSLRPLPRRHRYRSWLVTSFVIATYSLSGFQLRTTKNTNYQENVIIFA